MCCFEVSEFDIQSSAVGTLLDLINLTLSVSAGHAHGPRPSAPVVVIPMISQQSLGVIEKSDLYEVKFGNFTKGLCLRTYTIICSRSILCTEENH